MKHLLPLLLATVLGAAAADRPNFLWITSEDNSAWFVGCYGNPQARTPNLDRLAGEGIRYTHAYANAPVCAVVRSTWITGVCAISTGHPQHAQRASRSRSRSAPTPSCSARPATTAPTAPRPTTTSTAGTASAGTSAPARPTTATARKASRSSASSTLTTSHESSIFPKKGKSNLGEGPSPGEVFIPPHQPDLPGVRNDWSTYHKRVSAMDAEVGKILAELEADGLADDTIVAYCSDHGGVLPRSQALPLRNRHPDPADRPHPGEMEGLGALRTRHHLR